MMRAAIFAAALCGSLCAATPAFAQLFANKRADLLVPVKLEEGQAAIIVGFRRPDPMSLGKSGAVSFSRYDLTTRDLILQPKGAKKSGDKTTYSIYARSGDKTLVTDYAVMIVSAGDYVMTGAVPGNGGLILNTFCLGAPTFSVAAGDVVYFGDLTPYTNVRLVTGDKTTAMAYSSHPEDAQKALAKQPDLLAKFKVAAIRNEATYGCYGQMMTAYLIPGIAALEAPPPPATDAAAK
jgi:hypothetical protein